MVSAEQLIDAMPNAMPNIDGAVAGVLSSDGWLQHYLPRSRWFTNGHVQTIAGNYWPRKHDLSEAEAEVVEVEGRRGTLAASHVLCYCHWQPVEVRANRLTVLLIHGLRDTNLPARHSEMIQARNRMRSPAVALWEPAEAGHCGAASAEPAEFERRVIGWFESHPNRP